MHRTLPLLAWIGCNQLCGSQTAAGRRILVLREGTEKKKKKKKKIRERMNASKSG
jgi:hypothetical protein